MRQKQVLTLKQKIRRTSIIVLSIGLPIFFIAFIYMNLGSSKKAVAGVTYLWKGNTSSEWNTASNWSPNGIPGPADNVTINNGTGANFPKIGSSITFNQLAMSSGTLDLNGFTLTISGTISLSSCTVSNGNIAAVSFTGISSTILNNVNLEKTGNTSNTSNGNNTFNGDVTFTQTGNGTWTFSNSTGDIYNGAVTLNNNSASGVIQFMQNGSSTVNDNITVNNVSTGGVLFGAGSGSSTFAANKYITVGTFSAGPLTLNRITQSGSAAIDNNVTVTNLTINSSTLISGITANCTGTATLTGTTIKRKFIVSAANVTLNNANSLATSTGLMSITKTAGISNSWTGGNTFGSGTDTVSIINKGTGNITIGNTSGDNYNASTIILADSSVSSVLHVAYNGTTTFNGDIILSNTSTGGISFGNGSGSSTLAVNKTITTNGYTSGPLTINRSVQSGTSSLGFTAQPTVLIILNSTMTGEFNVAATSAATVNGSTFKKNFILTGPQVTLTNANSIATESGDIIVTKTGTGTNTWSGGNTFGTSGSTISITNSGTGTLTMANSNGDVFNGNVFLKQTSSGLLSAVTNSTSSFKRNLSTEGSVASITFGTGSGIVEMNGSSPQTISGSSTYLPIIRKLTINNNRNGVTLNVPLRIGLSLTMTSGNIYTTATNLLTIGTGISSVFSASDSSYIDGPLQKTGGQSFTFPVGKNGSMHLMKMSAPLSTTDQFTAEYIKADPTTAIGMAKDVALNHISNCDYWTFIRNTGTSNVTVTLSWTGSCSVTTLSDLRIARWDAVLSKWRDAGAVSTSGTIASGTVTTNTTTSSFGSFTLGSSTTNNALPVELILFTVEPEGMKAKIGWRTASEKDNDFFTVERSSDGRNFEIIGTVRGAGTSSQMNDYIYTDENPLPQISYYRLKQTDFNGHFEYFDPKSLTMEKTQQEFRLISANPNPFIDELNIKYFSPEEMQVDFKMLRVDGTTVLVKMVTIENGESSFRVEDAGSFIPGIYIIAITKDGKMLGTCRVIKK
ncbi:MAG: hypothetical protein ABI772_10740 [Bacteroidota bacterium]